MIGGFSLRAGAAATRRDGPDRDERRHLVRRLRSPPGGSLYRSGRWASIVPVPVGGRLRAAHTEQGGCGAARSCRHRTLLTVTAGAVQLPLVLLGNGCVPQVATGRRHCTHHFKGLRFQLVGGVGARDGSAELVKTAFLLP